MTPQRSTQPKMKMNHSLDNQILLTQGDFKNQNLSPKVASLIP
jgi:hypothetical protein